jgi:multimeric flavodoxin WrbA
MPNRIVFVHGGPRRNGNTRAITAFAIASARECGSQVEEIDAVTLGFKKPGCVGCQQCQESEAFLCAFDDDIAKKVATLPQYDVIVFATPLYWWSYPAQLKMFIDRMYSLTKLADPENYQSLLAGKSLALIATAGGPYEDNLELLERQLKNPADMLGCRFHSCLFPNTSSEKGSIVNNNEAIECARVFGKVLATA